VSDVQANEALSYYNGPGRDSGPASNDVTYDVIRQHRQVVISVIVGGCGGDRRGVVLRGGVEAGLLLRLLARRARLGAVLPVQLRRSPGAPAASAATASGLLRALRHDRRDAPASAVDDERRRQRTDVARPLSRRHSVRP